MKYTRFIFIGLIAAGLFYFGIFNREQPQPNSWETKTDDQQPVTISVTPVEFGKGVETWKFQVVFDTHSGSLDDDPTQIAVLMDDNGNTYKPIAWEGPGPGGHHREGALVFNPVYPTPAYVELKIKNVGGIPERLFRWNTK